MKQLRLNEGERLQLCAALCVTSITAPNHKGAGSLMRLNKKIFRSLLTKQEEK